MIYSYQEKTFMKKIFILLLLTSVLIACKEDPGASVNFKMPATGESDIVEPIEEIDPALKSFQDAQKRMTMWFMKLNQYGRNPHRFSNNYKDFCEVDLVNPANAYDLSPIYNLFNDEQWYTGLQDCAIILNHLDGQQ